MNGKRKQRGITLVETAATSTVLVVAIGAAAPMFQDVLAPPLDRRNFSATRHRSAIRSVGGRRAQPAASHRLSQRRRRQLLHHPHRLVRRVQLCRPHRRAVHWLRAGDQDRALAGQRTTATVEQCRLDGVPPGTRDRFAYWHPATDRSQRNGDPTCGEPDGPHALVLTGCKRQGPAGVLAPGQVSSAMNGNTQPISGARSSFGRARCLIIDTYATHLPLA